MKLKRGFLRAILKKGISRRKEKKSMELRMKRQLKKELLEKEIDELNRLKEKEEKRRQKLISIDPIYELLYLNPDSKKDALKFRSVMRKHFEKVVEDYIRIKGITDKEIKEKVIEHGVKELGKVFSETRR